MASKKEDGGIPMASDKPDDTHLRIIGGLLSLLDSEHVQLTGPTAVMTQSVGLLQAARRYLQENSK